MASFVKPSFAILAVFATWSVVGCSSSPSEILVTVNSDFTVPSQLDHIVVQSFDTSGVAVSTRMFFLHRGTSDTGDGTYALPLSFAIVPENGDVSRRASIDVQGFAAGSSTPLVDRKAIMNFQKGQKTPLNIFLASACVAVTCPGDQTCDIGGACVPILANGNDADAGIHADDAHVAADMNAFVDANMPTGDAAIVHDDSAVAVPTFASTPTQTINAPTRTNGAYGFGLAISADGTALAVGDHATEARPGYIDLFIRTGHDDFPTSANYLVSGPTASQATMAPFVSLSSDGSVLITCGSNGVDNSLMQYLNMTGIGPEFGRDPHFSMDAPSGTMHFLNGTPAISADAFTLAALADGTVYFFVANSAGFDATSRASITGPSGSTSHFGYGVALSEDGAEVAISDYGAGAGGVVYGYKLSGSAFPSTPTWMVARPSGDGGSRFGFAIALRPDGEELVVAEQNGATNHVHIFARSDSGFSLAQTLTIASGSNTTFVNAVSVGIAADGKTLVVGDYSAHVYVFSGE